AITEPGQQFRFEATDEDDVYRLYHPATKRYYGKLTANETQTAYVTDPANAGLVRIESSSNGWSALNNINHTGANAYIHLAG
ncbi:hypothetical protein, partial [Enterococcus faecalis]|uniref:hypothetical protein n=1 Tax=Enterococcus faecalis TaxID=1351 RepID=UPI00398696CF